MSNIDSSSHNINLLTDSDISHYSDIYLKYDIKNNISENIMTKYEYTKLLGIRTLQISLNSKCLIEITPDLDTPEKIAEEELRQRKTPYIIERKINDNLSDYWRVEDMVIDF